jgi:uncharacterized protein YecE (DUF72 family)
MEFGKVDPSQLDSIDFTLPPDPKETKDVLAKGKGKTKFYIGCAKWGRKDWVGKLYPPKTREKDFLHYYSTVFNSIEFNGTFYNAKADNIRKWYEQTVDNFIFCPKFTQTITHLKRLKNTDKEVDDFLQAISEFKEKLGPVFLMPHPQFAAKSLETLTAFIDNIPKDIDLFLELRNDSWYESGYNKELFAYLKKHKKGTIITDAAGARNFVHMHLSTPQCFIRFVGNALHRTDYERIDDWVQRIGQWMDAGLEKCYFFMHQHEELHSPELIRYFIEQLNTRCGTSIKVPEMQGGDALFN